MLGETSDKPEDIPIPHPEIFQAIKQKHALLIDDGKVRLRLLRKADTFAEAIVEVAGEIKDRKGVNMPDTLLPMSAMTPKDRADLDAALELGVDWIALSLCAAARRRGRTEEDRAGPRRRAGQDRKAQGAGHRCTAFWNWPMP